MKDTLTDPARNLTSSPAPAAPGIRLGAAAGSVAVAFVAAWILVATDWLGTSATSAAGPAADLWPEVVRIAVGMVVVHVVLRVIDAAWVFQDRRARIAALADTQAAISELRYPGDRRDERA